MTSGYSVLVGLDVGWGNKRFAVRAAFINQGAHSRRVNINSQCQRGPDTFPFTGRHGRG